MRDNFIGCDENLKGHETRIQVLKVKKDEMLEKRNQHREALNR